LSLLQEVEVIGIEVEDDEVNMARPGENVNVKLKGKVHCEDSARLTVFI